MGWVTWALSPTYRRRFAANAAQAGYGFAQVRAAVGHAGRMVFEMPRIWLGQLPECDIVNEAVVEQAYARGKGIARALVAHAKDWARDQGFRAMQFNFVVSTNADAVHSWQKAGFDIVGRLPGAFLHPQHGYVDALVMFHDLTKGNQP